jgi:hypothetical protein
LRVRVSLAGKRMSPCCNPRNEMKTAKKKAFPVTQGGGLSKSLYVVVSGRIAACAFEFEIGRTARGINSSTTKGILAVRNTRVNADSLLNCSGLVRPSARLYCDLTKPTRVTSFLRKTCRRAAILSKGCDVCHQTLLRNISMPLKCVVALLRVRK